MSGVADLFELVGVVLGSDAGLTVLPRFLFKDLDVELSSEDLFLMLLLRLSLVVLLKCWQER